MKEKMGLSDLEKDRNRLSFALVRGVGCVALAWLVGVDVPSFPPPTVLQTDGEYGDSAMGKQLGMVGQSGSGRLRITKKEKKTANKKMKKAVNAGSSGATAGFASSLAFTPVQGFELPAPNAGKAKHTTDTYFSATGTFTQIRPGT